MKTPTQLTKSFMGRRNTNWHTHERDWMKATFTILLKVARTHSEFTVDDIWAEIDKMTAAKKMPKSSIDHRILGPMIRHMVSEGLLGSSGYYTKSTRSGGGSRPVTIWESYMYTRTKVAA